MTDDTHTVVSYYHSGAVKRRTRPSLESANRLAAMEVESYGAHRADILLPSGDMTASYVYRGGLCYEPVTAGETEN